MSGRPGGRQGAVGRILGGLQNANLGEERERERDEQRESNTHLGACAPGADRCAHSAGPGRFSRSKMKVFELKIR